MMSTVSFCRSTVTTAYLQLDGDSPVRNFAPKYLHPHFSQHLIGISGYPSARDLPYRHHFRNSLTNLGSSTVKWNFPLCHSPMSIIHLIRIIIDRMGDSTFHVYRRTVLPTRPESSSRSGYSYVVQNRILSDIQSKDSLPFHMTAQGIYKSQFIHKPSWFISST